MHKFTTKDDHGPRDKKLKPDVDIIHALSGAFLSYAIMVANHLMTMYKKLLSIFQDIICFFT